MEGHSVNNPVQQAPVNPVQANKKPNQWIIVAIILALLILFGSIYILSQQQKENQVVCIQDVKQCPDGSYVSRQPPTCEFAKCR